MAELPENVASFLSHRRIAVAGVSRESGQPANAVFRRLRESGHDVVPVNPGADEVEGERCFPDLASIPEPVEAVMIVTPVAASIDVVEQCASLGIEHVWFHRSFGDGSASAEAVAACEANGIEAIVGGCPLMYCDPIDLGHRCMRWWLARKGRVPR